MGSMTRRIRRSLMLKEKEKRQVELRRLMEEGAKLQKKREETAQKLEEVAKELKTEYETNPELNWELATPVSNDEPVVISTPGIFVDEKKD